MDCSSSAPLSKLPIKRKTPSSGLQPPPFKSPRIWTQPDVLNGMDCGGVGVTVAKSVLNVFDECIKDVQMVISNERLRLSGDDFEKRWRQQRSAELDVFARRLRFILHNSLNTQSPS